MLADETGAWRAQVLGGARRGAGKEAPDLGLPLSGPLPQLYLHLLAKELRRGLRSALLTLTLGARTSLWWPTASSGPVGQSGQSLPTPRPPAASQSVLCTLCKPGRRRPRGSAQLVLPGSGAAVLRAGPGPGAIPTGGRAAGGGVLCSSIRGHLRYPRRPGALVASWDAELPLGVENMYTGHQCFSLRRPAALVLRLTQLPAGENTIFAEQPAHRGLGSCPPGFGPGLHPPALTWGAVSGWGGPAPGSRATDLALTARALLSEQGSRSRDVVVRGAHILARAPEEWGSVPRVLGRLPAPGQ